MSSPPEIKLAWCDFRAAKYAVENWHYSQSIPNGKTVNIGAWENGQFIGCVQFGMSARPDAGSPWKLPQEQVCELQRVALTKHLVQTSQIVSGAVRMLKKHSPGLRLIISYADPNQGHHGGIYQAMNWFYTGSSRPQTELIVNGKFMHRRTAGSRFGTSSVAALQARGLDVIRAPAEWKHRYVLPLDRRMRKIIIPTALPYPKREVTPSDADTTGVITDTAM